MGSGLRRRRRSEEHLAATEPVFAKLVGTLGPCTLPLRRRGDPFACLAKSIVSQMISTQAARTVQARLEARLGGEPSPARVLQAEASLRGVGLSRTKVGALMALAEAVQSGLDLQALGRRPTPVVSEVLTELPGIGPWTANMFLMFHLGRPDVFPARDLGVQEGLRVAFKLPARPTAAAARVRSEAWAPYRSTAAWYLWRVLDGPAEL